MKVFITNVKAILQIEKRDVKNFTKRKKPRRMIGLRLSELIFPESVKDTEKEKEILEHIKGHTHIGNIFRCQILYYK